jgi:type VI secretion system protein ImpA
MSDLQDAPNLIAGWMQPLGDESAPCGPDLEYDNQFLELTQAAAGKPESQFGPAEAPDWVAVREGAEDMLSRSRDLRLAVFWVRSGVQMYGYVALAPGLQLLAGMMRELGALVLPLPDPDDGDPYARVNALSVLFENQGLLGDLREAAVMQHRMLGRVTGRDVELAMLLAQPLESETPMGKDQLQRMLADAVDAEPQLRATVDDSLTQFAAFDAALQEFLGSAAPDVLPLKRFVKAVGALMPHTAEQAEGDGGMADGVAGAVSRGALTGQVGNRADALRAIDMVCEFLERTEPSNPAPLFLRRARQLVNHNFLQLMKELAPEAMASVARSVGVDPDSVQGPENP